MKRGNYRLWFEEKYIKQSEGKQCWIWLAATFPNGYGMFQYEGKPTTAHRMSYILYKGEIAKGLSACHTCDNKLCVNPEHLFLGKPRDNSRDMVRKGRSARGERHGSSKFTTGNVTEMKNLVTQGISLAEVGRKFDTTRHVIWNIINRSWKHVPN